MNIPRCFSIRHSVEGPAVVDSSGNRYWYYLGRLHREGGPAVEYADGGSLWFLHGDLHREDGPALSDGKGLEEYWLYGKRLAEERWRELAGEITGRG